MYQTYFSSAQDDDDDTRVINDLDGALWLHGKESHMCTHNSSTTYLLSAAVNRPATHIPAARARQTHTVPLTSSSSMGSIVAPTTAFSGTCPLSDDTHCKVLEVTIWLYPDMPDSMPTSSAMAQWPIRATHISSGRNILLLTTDTTVLRLTASCVVCGTCAANKNILHSTVQLQFVVQRVKQIDWSVLLLWRWGLVDDYGRDRIRRDATPWRPEGRRGDSGTRTYMRAVSLVRSLDKENKNHINIRLHSLTRTCVCVCGSYRLA